LPNDLYYFIRKIWGVFKTDWISRLKNDLNKFILTKMDNNPTNEEIETLIKAGDIIDKYRQ